LKWSDTDHNILASGGWDRAVHFWDVRLKTSVKQIFGSYIGGEAIDIKENKVLLGSNKPDLPLRVYDLKADKFHSINWPITS
jgi:WD40 repeat protein